MQRLQQLPESKAWKRRPASPDNSWYYLHVFAHCLAKQSALMLTFQIAVLQKDWRCISCLRKAGFMSFHPGHSGCLDGLLSAAAAMQEEMGQDKSGGSWSPYWPFDVSNVSDCSRFWLQLMDSNANKKLVWSWLGLFDFPKGVDCVHEAGAVWPKQSRGM